MHVEFCMYLTADKLQLYFMFQLVQCIGVLIYQALDFGLGENEEHALSSDLEKLIDRMTEHRDDGDETDQDEGIEEEEEVSSANSGGGHMTLSDVLLVRKYLHCSTYFHTWPFVWILRRRILRRALCKRTFVYIVYNLSSICNLPPIKICV